MPNVRRTASKYGVTSDLTTPRLMLPAGWSPAHATVPSYEVDPNPDGIEFLTSETTTGDIDDNGGYR